MTLANNTGVRAAGAALTPTRARARLRARVLGLAALLLSTTLVFTGCSALKKAQGGGEHGGSGGGKDSITVLAQAGYKFSPATVTVAGGHPITVSLKNEDSVAHNWEAEGVPNSLVPELAGKKSGSVTFNAPAPGKYRVVCTLPGHAEAGMVGELIVQ